MEDLNVCKCLNENEVKEYKKAREITQTLGKISKKYLNELGIEILYQANKTISELNKLKNDNRYKEKIFIDDIEIGFCNDDQRGTYIKIYPSLKIKIFTDFRGKENINYLIDFCKYIRQEINNKNINLFSNIKSKIILQKNGFSIKINKINLYIKKDYENFKWDKIKK
jgi:hypothetical protein